MDPSSKNWLSLMLDEFKTHVNACENSFFLKLDAYADEQQFCHRYLHQTGLFYGHIVSYFSGEYADSRSWNGADKFKVALLEGLACVYIMHTETKTLSKAEGEDNPIRQFLQTLYEFYVLFTMNATQSAKYRTVFQKNKEVDDAVEQIINVRVNNPSMIEREFWRGAQFNIFSALDIMYFSYWLSGVYEYDHRNTIKKEIISAMTAASLLEQETNKNVVSTLSYFIASGNFPVGEDLRFDEIDYEESRTHDSPLTRLLLYEYATYICLVDNKWEVKELLFLQNLKRELNLGDEETLQGWLMIDSYLSEYADQIFYLQYGEGLGLIKKAFANRVQAFVVKNKSKIVSEILGSKELVELIRKSVSSDLSDEEKQKIKVQILDLLKTIPSIAIFMIPGGTIILPILFKILPEELLIPSSFINKKNEK